MIIQRKFCLVICIAIIGFSFGIAAIEINAIIYDPIAEILGTKRLILELDMKELPEAVGRVFEVNFTAVTKAATVTVTMFFDGLIELPVWQGTSDFFVNERAIIDVAGSEIIQGEGHLFTILAEDSDNNTQELSQIMTVDTTLPVFTQMSLEHLDMDDNPSLVTTDFVALKEGEYLRINYTVFDENFDYVKFFIDEKTNEMEYPQAMSINFGSGYFTIEMYGINFQVFKLKIVAYDEALNEAEISWDVQYYSDAQDLIPGYQHEQELAEKEKQTKDAKNGAIGGTVVFGLIGAIGAIFSAKTSRDHLKGYAGWRDLDGLVKIKVKDEKIFKKSKRDWFKTPFNQYSIIISATIAFIGVLALVIGVFLKLNNYFIMYFLKTSLGSLLLFFLMVFFFVFQIIKGEFDDIFSNVTNIPKNNATGWLISYFCEGDKKYLITDNIVEAANSEYISFDFSEKDRMSYSLNIRGETKSTMYIPAMEIQFDKNGIVIKQFEMVGQKHIQEVMDGKTEEDRKKAKRLSDINQEIAVELKTTKDELHKTESNISTLARREADNLIISYGLTEKAMNEQLIMIDVEEPKSKTGDDGEQKSDSNTNKT